jgi:hypothetical protein
MDLIEHVATTGFAVVHRPDWVAAVAASPWEVARAIDPLVTMVERQPIKPVAHGRSFASRTGDAPLHTDSQLFLDLPARYQILACVRPAAQGGETLLVDGYALPHDDAAFRDVRVLRFVFGDVRATRVSSACESVLVTHTPHDRVTARPTVVALRAGDVIVVDNHRMLHGRTAFDDPHRELQRILAWSPRAFAMPPALLERARREGTPPRRLADDEPMPPLEVMRPIVEEMLRGVPPGVLAARHRVPEAHLYVYRDRISARSSGT